MRNALLALAASLSLVIAGCGSDEGVTVELDEYTVQPETDSPDAGPTTFVARNRGAIAHQLLVLSHTRPLRTTKAGVVDLDRGGVEVLGEIELVAPDASEDLTVSLEPGTYTLICNIAGHYKSGMSATITAQGVTEEAVGTRP